MILFAIVLACIGLGLLLLAIFTPGSSSGAGIGGMVALLRFFTGMLGICFVAASGLPAGIAAIGAGHTILGVLAVIIGVPGLGALLYLLR